MIHALQFLKGRMLERSTWIAIGAGVPIAAALSAPWSYVSLVVAIVAAMIPDAPKS